MRPNQAGGDELRALRALGALLTYPTRDLLDALPEIDGALGRSSLLTDADRGRLVRLIVLLQRGDPLAIEERYVELFDRGRATSLHLFEHVYGESRDRGAAMVDLMHVYAQAGLQLTSHELPDYLPAVLEYLSCRSLGEARSMLEDCAHIVRRIGETLARRGSPYAAVLAAVLSVAQVSGLDWSMAAAPPDPEAPIDEEWADAPAFAVPVAAAPQPVVMQFVRRKPESKPDGPR